MSANFNDLLASLAGVPALPGARCRGRSHLFDEQQPDEPADVAAQRLTQALGLCERCPALERCCDWFDALKPRERPAGAIAGRINNRRSPRPVKDTTA